MDGGIYGRICLVMFESTMIAGYLSKIFARLPSH